MGEQDVPIYFFLFCLLAAFAVAFTRTFHSGPSLTIVVLTSQRVESLERLLSSLKAAKYGHSSVHLHISVDCFSEGSRQDLLGVALALHWKQGRKTITSRVENAGLSRSWFESLYGGDTDYIALLEDDMEVSKNFYTVLQVLHRRNSLVAKEITSFCLHPGDWEVRVPRDCSGKSASKYLYLSPEPCNWGPVWKTSEWQKYIDWVAVMKGNENLPYVPERISYNYNKYLREGQDVQSSWVWRYNLDAGMRVLRYSFECGQRKNFFLAVNHKEPGTHFKKKVLLDNDARLLQFSLYEFWWALWSEVNAFRPALFAAYEENAASLHGR